MEMISKTKHNGVWYYDWNDIHAELTKVYPCATEILMEQYEGQLSEWMDGDHHFISRKTILPFLRWVGERGSLDASSFMYQIEKCIKKDMEQVRKMSRKYRWHVAWTQHYKCRHCSNLLHPKAFDIDHIVELSQGGTDTVDNLQALCVQCHAIKTRS